MAKLNQRRLNLYLKHLSHEELLDEIGVLFDKFAPVKDYYHAKLSDDSGQQVLEKYKTVIQLEFFPSRGLPPGAAVGCQKSNFRLQEDKRFSC